MIEADRISRHFGDVVAVNDITLQVPAGTILALLGPNGAGKTTTVRMLSGLLAATSGNARVASFDVQQNPAAVRANVGLVTDIPGLHEQMTAPRYLHFFGSIYGIAQEVRTRRIDELLEFFDLHNHKQERMASFSKGMKQKVALARALLHDPTALFLDEPTSGLDPLAARAVRDLVIALKNASRSIILCTHDLDEAERLADMVAIMHHGRILACDTPANLRAHASPEASVSIVLARQCSAATAALRGLTGLTGLSITSPEPDETTTSIIQYRTAQPTEINPQVLERLIGAGARVVSVVSLTRTLEDVYADVVSNREQAPSGYSS